MSRSRRIAVALWAVIGLLALWSFGIEPRWVARRDIEHAVAQWQGPPALRIAVAADWHIGRSAVTRVITPERARALVDEINAARPDAILLPGDFVADEGWPGAEREIAAELGRLKAPLGVYAVLGNHDHWFGGARMAAALRERGIVVLDNEARPLDAGVWIVGIGDRSTGHARPREALQRVPARAHALVLMHDPATLLDLPPVPGLVLAAHTHGGQVSVPGYGAVWLPGDTPLAWAHGWVRHEANTMYVTSGLGVSLLPLRFNMRPEWVLLRIVPALG